MSPGFPEIGNNSEDCAICSIISAGTFSIFPLNPTNPTISPLNVAIQSPYFTIEEVHKLFREFARDNDIAIEDGVVEDVLEKNRMGALSSLIGL
jgi:hypothetical protein